MRAGGGAIWSFDLTPIATSFTFGMIIWRGVCKSESLLIEVTSGSQRVNEREGWMPKLVMPFERDLGPRRKVSVGTVKQGEECFQSGGSMTWLENCEARKETGIIRNVHSMGTINMSFCSVGINGEMIIN